jgi:hypothetical protein
LTGRSEAQLSATVEDVDAGWDADELGRSIVSAPTQAELLRAQRGEEDRRAAVGYFLSHTAWRPLPPLERLRAWLRHGLTADLGGTIESRYLYRPEVAVRRPQGWGLDVPGSRDGIGAGTAARRASAAETTAPTRSDSGPGGVSGAA